MKTMKRISVLVLTVLMISSVNSYAQRGRNYENRGQGMQQERMTCQIPDLTEDQQNKIDALRIAHIKEMTTYKNKLNELRARKHTLMTSDNADMKEINSVIDQMTEVQNKKMKLSAKHRQDIRSLLTDDQKVYFDSRPMKHHGNRQGNGRGQGAGCRANGGGKGFGQGF